jgi:hypothetical protein
MQLADPIHYRSTNVVLIWGQGITIGRGILPVPDGSANTFKFDAEIERICVVANVIGDRICVD